MGKKTQRKPKALLKTPHFKVSLAEGFVDHTVITTHAELNEFGFLQCLS